MVTYGTTAIPSDIIDVVSGGTVQISAAFENTMTVVGGMDTGNGSATPGDVVEVTDPTDAQSKFGDGSELHEQSKLAFQNGVGELYMMPVSETSVTAETQTTQDGTLDNAPIFDPNVNDEHDITCTDTTDGSMTVVIEYGSLSAPSDADTVRVNPVTGDYHADAAPTGDYEFDYAHGDYSATALQPAVDQSSRIVTVCTENESVVNDLASEINDNATDFDFMHSVAGAAPRNSNDDSNTYANNYSDGVDERRVSLVAPSRGYVDDAETNMVRTAGAVGGYLASLALGLSATGDSVGGFTGLRTELSPGDAGTLVDAQVLPMIDYPPVEIVKDMTTSTDSKFERVQTMQIVDEAAEISHLISRTFIGEQNTTVNRRALDRSHRNAYIGMRDTSPPQLDDFAVTVKEDSSNANEVDVTIGLDVVDIMDTIDVSITVGDIIRNNGAS